MNRTEKSAEILRTGWDKGISIVVSAKSTVSANCVDLDCNHDGKLAADRGKTMALVSTIGFGVGLAGLVTGTVLLLTVPARKPAARVGLLAAGENGALFGVRGVW